MSNGRDAALRSDTVGVLDAVQAGVVVFSKCFAIRTADLGVRWTV